MPQPIVQPVTTSKDRKTFIDFPYRHYRDSAYWIPALRVDQAKLLDPGKNPFFEHGRIQCFLARNASGEVVGRIAGIINGMHLKTHDDGNGFVGFYECIDDPDTSAALFDAAFAWLSAEGMTGARGPTNPSMNDVSGLLVDGFDRKPSIMMPYNFDYYERDFRAAGFEKAMTMWAYYVDVDTINTDHLTRGALIVRKRNPGVTLRNLDMKKIYEEARVVREIYNEAWSGNWGNVPFTEAEMKHLVDDLKQIVDPKLVYLVELDEKTVAFSITIPNANQLLERITDGRLFPFGLLKLLWHSKMTPITEARTIIMGVLPDYQGRGLDALMAEAILTDGPANGYIASELSWILDSNRQMLNVAKRVGAIPTKEYAMFERAL